ncbi:hypothetical protein FLGSB24_21750 [Flavobacterium sp. GSB-24]|nr:hypothetical protein FLGSB24_21750 [Flavobacterium sp. GSB-24]
MLRELSKLLTQRYNSKLTIYSKKAGIIAGFFFVAFIILRNENHARESTKIGDSLRRVTHMILIPQNDKTKTKN